MVQKHCTKFSTNVDFLTHPQKINKTEPKLTVAKHLISLVVNQTVEINHGHVFERIFI